MNTQIKKAGVLCWILIFLFSIHAQSGSQIENFLTVCVTDENGRYLSGLKSESLQILIDGKRQEISSFTEQDAPATIVFMIDLSASQKRMVAPLAKILEEFIKNADPNNEYIVIAFNEKVQLILDKSQDFQKLEEALDKTLNSKTKGNTAFYDSVYLGIEKAESGKYQKKVIIAFSDGNDNQSRLYKLQDVIESIKQSSVLFYGVNYLEKADSIAAMDGNLKLEVLSEISGGQSFSANKPNELSDALKRISLELKSQYQVGFKIADTAKSNKWQKVKIKVEPLTIKDKKIKLLVRNRSGFYSTSAK